MQYQIRERAKKNGQIRYSVVLEVWVDGKRQVISGGTHDTERAAIGVGETLLIQHETDADKVQALMGNQKLRTWGQNWLDTMTKSGATKNSYEWRMQNAILPHLGNYALKSLAPPLIYRWINGPMFSHYAKSTRQGFLDCLRICLGAAVTQGVITHNPARNVSLDLTKAQKKSEKSRRKVKTFNYSDVDRILEASVGRPMEPMVILGLLAGLRPGESAVTRWSDINWVEGTVLVSRTRSRAGFKGRLITMDTTKTGDVRFARLTSDAVLRLMRLKEVREAKGPFDPDEEIYAYPNGSSNTPWHQLRVLCENLGIDRLSPHCFRHTHASLLLENGATLAAVAKQLGHANPTVTASVYWHLMDPKDDTISGVMDRALQKVILEPYEAHTGEPLTVDRVLQKVVLEPYETHTGEPLTVDRHPATGDGPSPL